MLKNGRRTKFKNSTESLEKDLSGYAIEVFTKQPHISIKINIRYKSPNPGGHITSMLTK